MLHSTVDPGGEPLAFHHGYTGSWFSFSRLLPLLPAGYHAFALGACELPTALLVWRPRRRA